MVVLIIGVPDSGKSRKAENLLLELSGGGKKAYIATMVPFGKEGAERIEKHRKMREGKGFETFEQPVHIERLLQEIPDLSGYNALLECMSNLVGNEMYAPENSGLSSEELLNIILSEVKAVSDCAQNIVIVSNHFSAENENYDEETLKYIELVEKVNDGLKEFVDKCIEYKEGVWIEE
jgi:adenosylcobinamide kinase/adenosylcobinamide-phosphate guanylyltransferase